MIAGAVKQPITEPTTVSETCLAEKTERLIVILAHDNIDLMQVKRTACIIQNGTDSSGAEPLPSGSLLDDDSKFCTLVLRIEIHEVNHADSLSLGIGNDKSQLAVSIDVCLLSGNVIVQSIARVWHIGMADAPDSAVVLNGIEVVKVLGFQCTKMNSRCCHFRISSVVIIMFSFGR